jgi:hypothetical protein
MSTFPFVQYQFSTAALLRLVRASLVLNRELRAQGALR